jgi:hypothetical protein
MHKNLWLVLALFAATITACSQEQMQEIAENTMVTENRTPDKIWRVKPGSVHDGDTFRAIAEKDQYGRSVAEVYAMTDQPNIEVGVNGEMVAAGMAHYYERYKSACPINAEQYEFLEQQAISSKAGVWANGDAEPPWDWRKANK